MIGVCGDRGKGQGNSGRCGKGCSPGEKVGHQYPMGVTLWVVNILYQLALVSGIGRK
jgi:hypothetical protein